MEQITRSMSAAYPSLTQIYPPAAPVSYGVSRPFGYEELQSTNPCAAELLAQPPTEGSTHPFAAEMLAMKRMAFPRKFRPVPSPRSMADGKAVRNPQTTLPSASLMINGAPSRLPLPVPASRVGVSQYCGSPDGVPPPRGEQLLDQSAASAEARQESRLLSTIAFAPAASRPEESPTAGCEPIAASAALTVGESLHPSETNGYQAGANDMYTRDPAVLKSMHDRLDALVEEVAQLRTLLSNGSHMSSLWQLPVSSDAQAGCSAVHCVQDQASYGSFDGEVHFTGGYLSKRGAESTSNNPSRITYETLIPTTVNGIKVTGLWDTGASISLISASLARRLNLKMNSASISAALITGDELLVTGFATAKMQVGRIYRRQRLYVVSDVSHELVLGTDFLAKLPPITYDYMRGTVHVGGQLLSFCGSAEHVREDDCAYAAPAVAAVPCSKRRKRSRPRRHKLQIRTESCAGLFDPSIVAYKLESTSQTVNTNRYGKELKRPLLATITDAIPSSAPAAQPAARYATAEAEREAVLPLQCILNSCMLSNDRAVSLLHFCTNEPNANVGRALTD